MLKVLPVSPQTTMRSCVMSRGDIHSTTYHGQGVIQEGFPEEVT